LILYEFIKLILSPLDFFKEYLYRNTDLFRYTLFPQHFSEQQRAVIVEEISFYSKLTSKEQKAFEHRVLQFIKYHRFVGREDLLVTERMQLLIAATAVMITFGFKRYLLSRFENILVYPQHYFSNITQQFHKGEANPTYRTLVFSWEDFEEGIKIEDDNLNLGIHELTHALHFSFLTERSYSARLFLISKEAISALFAFI